MTRVIRRALVVSAWLLVTGCKGRDPDPGPVTTPDVVVAATSAEGRLRSDTGVEWDVIRSVDRSVLLAPRSPLPARAAADRAVSARDFVARYRPELGLADPELELVPVGHGADDLMIFEQRVSGVPIDGCELRVRFGADHAITMVFGRLLEHVEATTAIISAADAIAAATAAIGQRHEGFDASWLADPPTAALAYWAPGIEGARLTFRVTLVGRESTALEASQVWIDAITGEVAWTAESMHRVRKVVAGQTAWRSTIQIDVEQRGEQLGFWRPASVVGAGGRCSKQTIRPELELRDAKQGFGILRGELVVASLAELDGRFGPLGQGMAIDAYSNVERVAEYFRSVFCRSSWDGAGAKLIVLVDGNGWGAFRAWQRAFVFGRGRAERIASGGTQDADWFAGSATLEFAGHEYVHAIVSSLRARFSLPGPEEAALEEAVGDVFGQLIEAHYQPKYGERLPDLDVLGEHAGRHPKTGAATPFRSLADPAKFGAPAKMGDFKPGGDAHVNSGIVAHAFWRMVRGTSRATLPLEVAQHVWYGAIGNWSAGITLAGFARQTILSAKRANAPLAPVACAWVDLGVLFPEDTAPWVACPVSSAPTILGHWAWTKGDWGTVSFVLGEPLYDAANQVRGHRVRGAYTYRQGTIALECDSGLRRCTGEWLEESRGCTTKGDRGRATFRVTNTDEVDGTWTHLGSTGVRDDWDLKRSADPVPKADRDRIADDSLFRCR